MSLLDNLAGYWKLDESSGTRDDSLGVNHLAEQDGTISSGTGIINNAADFELADARSLARLSGFSALEMDPNSSFTVAAWIKLESTPADVMTWVSKGRLDALAIGTRGFEYALEWWNGGSLFNFGISGAAEFADQVNVAASSFGAVSAGNWYFVVGWYDAVDEMVRIQVNDGDVDQAAHANGAWNSGTPFVIGSFGHEIQRCDGLIDEVGVWKRVLTSEERTFLYNAGAGRTFPFSPKVALARF